MRIEGPRPTDGVKKNDKARKTGGASGEFKAFLDGDADGVGEAFATPMVVDVGSLLAAQAAEDPSERKARKRMQERAERVLDSLDGVRKGLLDGTLNTRDLERVSQSVTEKRESINDPVLAGILDEVDLRAKVELAKMEMAKEKL